VLHPKPSSTPGTGKLPVSRALIAINRESHRRLMARRMAVGAGGAFATIYRYSLPTGMDLLKNRPADVDRSRGDDSE